MNDSINKDDFNSIKLLAFLYKWRKHLIIIAVTSAVLSAFFASPIFIKPKFKSTLIMFPTTSNAISKAILNPASRSEILEFGDEEQSEQLIQVLNSMEITRRIIQKYKLMQHYNIDSTSKYHMTKLVNEYNSNVTFKRTEYMAVEVNVYDTDPVYAANIANDIGCFVDTVKNNIEKGRAKAALKIAETEYNIYKNKIKTLEDSIDKIRNLGVVDYETESTMLHRQYAMEVAKNNTRGIKALQDKINVLAKYSGPFVAIRDELGHLRGKFNDIQIRYEEAKIDVEQNIPQKFVVDYASKAEKKSYPIIWLITLITTVSALFLAIIGIIIYENFQKNSIILNS